MTLITTGRYALAILLGVSCVPLIGMLVWAAICEWKEEHHGR